MVRYFCGALTVVLIAVFMGACPAVADDINIPDWWWFGDPWSDPARTVVGWEFEVDPGIGPTPIPLPPDWGNNLNGPLLEAEWLPGPDEWIDILDPQPAPMYDPRFPPWDDTIGTGIVALSGELIIPIWNDPTPRPEKKVWIQLTWMPQDGASIPFPIIEAIDLEPGASQTPAIETNTIPLGGPWVHSTFEFSILPNPPFETIRIAGDINVDELIIDTYCVPEPASLALVGIGALLLVGRRR